MAKALKSALAKAQRRNWLNFWTRDVSWIMWDNFATASWSPLDQRMPQRIRQTIGAKKSMLTVGFSPAEFLIIDVRLQDITFVAEYFIARVLPPLHQHRRSPSQDVARQKHNLHFGNSRCHTTWSVMDEMAKLRCKPVAHSLYSPDLAICDFSLFSRLKDKHAGFHADDDAKRLEEGQGMLQRLIKLK
jgi:hypothetical protein